MAAQSFLLLLLLLPLYWPLPLPLRLLLHPPSSLLPRFPLQRQQQLLLPRHAQPLLSPPPTLPLPLPLPLLSSLQSSSSPSLPALPTSPLPCAAAHF